MRQLIQGGGARKTALECPRTRKQDKRRRHVVASKSLSAQGFRRHAPRCRWCLGNCNLLIFPLIFQHAYAATRPSAGRRRYSRSRVI